MKRLAKQAALGISMVGVVAGLAFLALALVGPWGGAAKAEPQPTVGIDGDPYADPANQPTSLGSIQACITAVSTPYDDDGDTVADEDDFDGVDNDDDGLTDEDPPGQLVDIDVYIKDAPAMAGFYAAFNYDPDVLRVVGNDIQQFLAAGSGSTLLDVSGSLPDTDGDYGTGALDISGPHESGEGVVVRLTLQTMGSGVSQADLITVTLYDANYDYIPPTDQYGRYQGPVFNGLIAVDDECPDSDHDTIPDGVDNCLLVPNPDQLDTDGDGWGDACDNCPGTSNWDQADGDDDDAGDVCDNCPQTANGDQANHDTDSYGDACDLDDDNDGFVDTKEAYYGSDPINPASKVEVCNGLDNDGDGRFDEDPVDGIDNDGDKLVDEDPLDATGTDDDGDTLINEGYDYNGDTVIDENWDLNGNTVPDCLDASADTDGDTVANTLDSDDDNDGDPDPGFNDGIPDWKENWMGTDTLDACPDNTNDDAWPPDVKNDGNVVILDAVKFKWVIGSKLNGGGPKDHTYDRRYDMNADERINILDVLKLKPFINTACS
jgi:hypothetical protein